MDGCVVSFEYPVTRSRIVSSKLSSLWDPTVRKFTIAKSTSSSNGRVLLPSGKNIVDGCGLLMTGNIVAREGHVVIFSSSFSSFRCSIESHCPPLIWNSVNNKVVSPSTRFIDPAERKGSDNESNSYGESFVPPHCHNLPKGTEYARSGTVKPSMEEE